MGIGIRGIVVGIACIIISQTITFTEEKTKNIFLYLGIIALIIGGIFISLNISKQNSDISNSRPSINNKATTQTAADELLKLKNLLDQSAITQQEYDDQKKKLLSA